MINHKKYVCKQNIYLEMYIAQYRFLIRDEISLQKYCKVKPDDEIKISQNENTNRKYNYYKFDFY